MAKAGSPAGLLDPGAVTGLLAVVMHHGRALRLPSSVVISTNRKAAGRIDAGDIDLSPLNGKLSRARDAPGDAANKQILVHR